MDASLMNMMEVAYQIRNHSSILVGSEETELANGWPYNLLLEKLRDEPEVTREMLSSHIKTSVIGEIHEGYDMRNSHGLSIYFPFSGDDSMYYHQITYG